MTDTQARMRDLEDRILDLGDLSNEINEHVDDDGNYHVFRYSGALVAAMREREITCLEEADGAFYDEQEDLIGLLEDLEEITGRRSRLRDGARLRVSR